MKKFFVKLAFLILFLALSFLGWQNRELRHDKAVLRETVAQLESERRDLQQRAATAQRAPKPEELATVRQQIEEQTSELRGLKFLRPVNYKTIERRELKDLLLKKLKEHYSEAELRDWGRSLSALGLVPEGTDVMEAMIGLYDEQIGAFYIPEEHALYTFKDQTWTSGLDRMFLAHELTHALQDQNFDLLKFPLEAKDNDDLVLATAALVEGDATVLMTQYYAENADPGSIFNDVGAMLGQNTAKLAAAPAFLREMLLFPYQEGQAFAMAVFLKGGTTALNEVFRSPPVSTEQILHPEKFQGHRDDPVTVELAAVASKDWRLIGNNVLGEFGIRCLLNEGAGAMQAQLAAQGWGGDRYNVYERGTNGPTAFIWQTVWDSEQDAVEFEEAYDSWLAKQQLPQTTTTSVRRDGVSVTIRRSADPSFTIP